MRKTFATMLTMGLAAGFVSAQTPGSGVGAGGTSPANSQRPIGTEGAAGSNTRSAAGSQTTGSQGTAGGTTGSQGTAGSTAGSSGTGGATSSRGASVGGTQGAGGAGGTTGTTGSQGTAGSATRGGQGTGTSTGAASGRGGTLGGQGTATGTAGSTTGTAGDPTRSGAASDPANAQMSTDTLFAAAAAAGGMAEVGTSRIAMDRASSDEIKQFAQRMVEDHTRANRELMGLATQKGMQLPRGLDVKDQADVAILSNLRGEEFDKAYAKQQYAAHICAVNQFTAESQMGRDPELKAWAAKTLPALKEHKMMIKTIVDRYEKSEQGAGSHDR